MVWDAFLVYETFECSCTSFTFSLSWISLSLLLGLDEPSNAKEANEWRISEVNWVEVAAVQEEMTLNRLLSSSAGFLNE